MLKKSISHIPVFTAGDLTHLQEVIHPKNDGVKLGYSLAKASLLPGQQSLLHSLSQSELYYFLQGIGEMTVNEDQVNVKAGDVLLVPAFAKQQLLNKGENRLEFLCIVSPPWTAEGEEVL